MDDLLYYFTVSSYNPQLIRRSTYPDFFFQISHQGAILLSELQMFLSWFQILNLTFLKSNLHFNFSHCFQWQIAGWAFQGFDLSVQLWGFFQRRLFVLNFWISVGFWLVVAQLGEAIPDMIDLAIIWSMVRECERLFTWNCIIVTIRNIIVHELNLYKINCACCNGL